MTDYFNLSAVLLTGDIHVDIIFKWCQRISRCFPLPSPLRSDPFPLHKELTLVPGLSNLSFLPMSRILDQFPFLKENWAFIKWFSHFFSNKQGKWTPRMAGMWPFWDTHHFLQSGKPDPVVFYALPLGVLNVVDRKGTLSTHQKALMSKSPSLISGDSQGCMWEHQMQISEIRVFSAFKCMLPEVPDDPHVPVCLGDHPWPAAPAMLRIHLTWRWEHKGVHQHNLIFGGMRKLQFTYSVYICSMSSFLHPSLGWRKTVLGKVICPQSSLYYMRCPTLLRRVASGAEWHYGGRETVERGSQGHCGQWSLTPEGQPHPSSVLLHVLPTSHYVLPAPSLSSTCQNFIYIYIRQNYIFLM